MSTYTSTPVPFTMNPPRILVHSLDILIHTLRQIWRLRRPIAFLSIVAVVTGLLIIIATYNFPDALDGSISEALVDDWVGVSSIQIPP